MPSPCRRGPTTPGPPRTPSATRSATNKHGRLRGSVYDEEIERIQEQLVQLQYWIQRHGLKVLVIFEGRGSAGKGGVIKRITERTSPRTVRVVALPKPTDRQRTQWYFERYVEHLPAAGEMVLFHRSWYNRSNVRLHPARAVRHARVRVRDLVPLAAGRGHMRRPHRAGRMRTGGHHHGPSALGHPGRDQAIPRGTTVRAWHAREARENDKALR